MTTLLLASAIVLSAQPNAEQLQLLKVFREEFISITPGEGRFPKSFQMGGERKNEQPTRRVVMSRPFQVAKYEVPQNLWRAVMGSNPSKWTGERNSVEMLSHGDAVSFCDQATVLMRAAKLIGANDLVRLPSEAEWEYVARAGTTTRYSFGDDPADLGPYGWFNGNAAGNDPPIGAKKPNAWGLYDVHGYLWEWCADQGADSYENPPESAAPRTTGGDPARRVLRGGSWKDPADVLDCAHRRLVKKDLLDDAVGLRCVLAPAR